MQRGWITSLLTAWVCACGAPAEQPPAEPAVEIGPSGELELVLYELGWNNYKLGRYPEAIRRFAEMLDLVGADTETVSLRDEAIEQIVILLLDEDWDGDGFADQRDGPTRLRDPELINQASPWLGEVCRRLGEMYGEMGQRELAARALETCGEDR